MRRHPSATAGAGLDEAPGARPADASVAGTPDAVALRVAEDASWQAWLARRSELAGALRDFRSAHDGGSFSAQRMIDPLLDLWTVAVSVDRRTARPIEVLLKALVDRAMIRALELCACLDEVQSALDDLPS